MKNFNTIFTVFILIFFYTSIFAQQQIGNDIDGEAVNDQSGWSVSMSSDGTRVAIGARFNNGNGHVRIYQESGGSWTQIGNDIDGEAGGDQSGYSVSISSDGTRVAIGARLNDGNGSSAGHVRIYQESGGSWTQIGSDIDGEAAFDNSGYTVSMSSDGTRVAIGAPFNDGNVNNAGHVRIYQESGGSWTQIGNDIDGDAAGDQSGYPVSMSSDGTRVAIGAINNDGNGNNVGHVRTYQESGGSWTQIGNDIDGEAVDDQSGWSVSMSSDGTRVAIGTPFNDGNGNSAGHVRVYDCVSILPVELVDFNATTQKDHIHLNWTTSDELNNTGFEIQKSKTGEDWQSIDFVPANEVLREINIYQFKDYNLFAGRNYYRLKQIDTDSAFDYSNIVSATYNPDKKTLQVYPNPTNGLVNIQMENTAQTSAIIKIYVNVGRLVLERKLDAGYSQLQEGVEIKGRGVYIIAVQVGQETFYERVVVE